MVASSPQTQVGVPFFSLLLHRGLHVIQRVTCTSWDVWCMGMQQHASMHTCAWSSTAFR